MQHNNGDANVLKGLVAGLAAGLVASWTMNQFQAAWTRLAAGFEKPHGAQSMQPSKGPNPNETPDQPEAEKEHQDDATVETAKVISRSEFYGRRALLQPGNREWVTVIECTNASGWALPPYVIFKGKVFIESWFDGLPEDWRFEVSPNG